MTLTVFLAVLGAALLHATWNAVVRFGEAKVKIMFAMTLIQAGLGFIVAISRDFPDGDVWLWLIGSGFFHATYKIFLALAYEQGDLSRVYPIARGTAPILVLVVGSFILADRMSLSEVAGVLILGSGIILMSRGALLAGESRRLVPLALCSAVATAGYSIVDGLGARVAGDAVTFVAWLFVFDALIFTPIIFFLRGFSVAQVQVRTWQLGGVAATASYGAYVVAVWAMTQAPIALVAALRETSILFAVMIGWLVFHERMDVRKAIAAAIIILGVATTRF